MIKSIKKFSYERRPKTLGLLTVKKGMSNLRTVMKAKVKVCLKIYTHKGKGKAIRKSKMEKGILFFYNLQLDSATEEISGARNCGRFTKRLLDRHRGTQNFQG